MKNIIIPLVISLVLLAGCRTIQHGIEYDFEALWDKNAKEKIPYHIIKWTNSDIGTKILNEKTTNWTKSDDGTKTLNEKSSTWAKGKVSKWWGLIVGISTTLFASLGWLLSHLNARQRKNLAKMIKDSPKNKKR